LSDIWVNLFLMAPKFLKTHFQQMRFDLFVNFPLLKRILTSKSNGNKKFQIVPARAFNYRFTGFK